MSVWLLCIGKIKEEVEVLFEFGIYKVFDFKKDWWIMDIKYVDEVSWFYFVLYNFIVKMVIFY